MSPSPHPQEPSLAAPAGFRCAPLSPVMAAEVTGLDLAQAGEAELAQLAQLLLEHKLVVLRRQQLSDADIERFAAYFGPLEVNQVRDSQGRVFPPVHSISNVDSQGRPSQSPLLKSNYNWHSDKSYLPQPSLMTMLWGMEIPPTGGDTEFANMERAYEGLPEATQRAIADLRVVHSFEYMLDKLGQRAIIDPAMIPAPVTHPMVRTHPLTGHKSLFLGMYNGQIEGMGTAESQALIAELLAHATQEKFCFTQKWQPFDFVFWDNRNLIHRAIPNYEMGVHRRVLRRCVVRGSVPL